jgi:hypothetical protein
MLAFQMIWTSYSTTKFISADMKFKDGQEKKEEKKEAAAAVTADDSAAPADDSAAPADDSAAPADDSTDTTDDSAASTDPAQPVTPTTPDVEPTPAPVTPVTPEETDHAVLEVVDRNNGTLVLKDGTVKQIKDGKVISINGTAESRPRDATKSEKDSLEKEEQERNKFVEEGVACTGWFCM